MAIYSLRHTPIGRSTQRRPHTTAAHVGYISRPQAARHFMAERMPDKPKEAARYLRQMEDGDRVNARIADKVMLALPEELDAEQRVELVRGFANDVTKGRAPWLAAIHDKGKDAHNPHCHLLIRDRCPASGKRVIGMSDAGSTDMLREKWEQHANRALERAGHQARIDRRSLKAQGIDRAPTIHEGPNVRAMEKRGARPRSRMRNRRNGRGAMQATRQVDYPSIDRGQTRPDYNRALRGQETEADYWQAVDQDAQRREFEERGLGADYRRAQKAAQRPPSVQNVSRFPSQPQQGDEAGRVSFLDRPLGIPPGLPGDTAGLSARPARFEPSPDGVAGRKGKNEAANDFAEGSIGAKFSHERPEASNVKDHIESMGPNSHSGKEGDVSDQNDWLGRQHANRLDAAQKQADESRGRFDDLMKRSYLNPDGAEKAMNDYRNKHGEQALYDRLNRPVLGSPTGHGMTFGRRPGSILSTDRLKKDAGDRRLDSLDTRRHLADSYKRMHEDQEALRAAKQTHSNHLARQAAGMQPAATPGAEPQPHQQHRGLEQTGQPRGAPRAGQQPQPDLSRMNPNERQARPHEGMERPQPRPAAEPHPGDQHRGLEHKGKLKGAPGQNPQTQPDLSRMSPEERQARQHEGLEQPQPKQATRPHPGHQHRGLEQKGRPEGAAPAQKPQPDYARMSPDARQARQHHGLPQPAFVPPATTPARPMPAVPSPAGAAAPLAKPTMAPAPGQGGGKAPAPSAVPKKRGMEM